MNDNATAIDNNTVATNSPANDAQFDFSVSANVSEQIFVLIGQRKAWDNQNVEASVRSKKALQQILSPIYNMGWTIANNSHPDQDIQSKFDDYCKERHIKFHRDTSYFVRICKVVFGQNEGSRYSAYGNALNVAYAEGTPMGGLIDFLDEVGGIEEARRMTPGTKTSKSTGTLADKASQSVDQVTSRSAARITDSAICELVDRHQANGLAVLLVSRGDDGALTLHSVSQADSIVNRVVLQAGKDGSK